MRVLPPVVMLITASVVDAMTGTNWRYTSGFGVGRPSDGSRACRWMIAAPASAASIDCLAICSGVSGRYSDIDGVWVDPVIAQEMMTLRFEFFIVFLTVNGAPVHYQDCRPAFRD